MIYADFDYKFEFLSLPKPILLKNPFYIAILALLFTACKPTANIITSKDEAVKKGIYTQPVATVKPEAKINLTKKVKVKNDIVVKQKKQIFQKNIPGINENNDADIFIDSGDSNYLVEQLINSASDNLGTPYRSGGTNKEGFDCSGLMFSTFKKFDITLPRSSHEMADIGTKIALDNAKKGDLIFFINRGQHRINHVGMVVEVNGSDVKFIHSSTQSGVVISSIQEPYYQRTFVQLSRIVD
jgi:lipoprotein Spr